MESDEVKQFLRSLPNLKENQNFNFRCSTEVACFNQCCADLNLVLSPYDVLRLRHVLGMPSRPFLEQYTRVAVLPETGFPEISLMMNDDTDKTCPFVTPQGCRLYDDRPSACRMYPVGRGACVNSDGQIQEQFILLKEDHCLGFQSEEAWTVKTWQEDQDLEKYNRSNDLYLRLENGWRKKSKPLSREQFSIAILALYRPDAFQRFLRAKDLLNRTGLSQSKKDDILQNEAECLAFALRWFESVVLSSVE